MLTLEQNLEARLAQINEEGTERPCPACGRPRVARSDYIRCNPCAVNWLEGEDWDLDPRVERYKLLLSQARLTSAIIPDAAAPSAKSGEKS